MAGGNTRTRQLRGPSRRPSKAEKRRLQEINCDRKRKGLPPLTELPRK